MKRMFLLSTVIMFVMTINVQTVSAAEGWTWFGDVLQAQITEDDVRIQVDTGDNPSACSHATQFYYDGDSGTVNRFYAAALTAISTGSQMRVYVGDICNDWGHANITNINIRP